MVEFLVAGLFAGSALGVFVAAFFPDDAVELIEEIEGFKAPAGAAALALVTALAYSFGVVFEYLGRLIFEWRLDQIKDDRLVVYAETLDKLQASDPTLAERLAIIGRSHGLMRFFVLGRNPALYGEIDLQIARMRLARVLFLSECLAFVAGIRLLLRDCSPLLLFGCGLMAIFGYITVRAVTTQFNRYCRAIERSCTMLLLDESGPHGQPAADPSES